MLMCEECRRLAERRVDITSRGSANAPAGPSRMKRDAVWIHMNAIFRATMNAFAIATGGIAGVIVQSCGLRSGSVSTVSSPNVAVHANHRSDVVPCPPSATIPSDWQTVVDETGTYELRIPRTFRPAPAGKYAFVHGGQVWQRGDATISLSFGHWAEYSFQDQVGQRCRFSMGDADVF